MLHVAWKICNDIGDIVGNISLNIAEGYWDGDETDCAITQMSSNYVE